MQGYSTIQHCSCCEFKEQETTGGGDLCYVKKKKVKLLLTPKIFSKNLPDITSV